MEKARLILEDGSTYEGYTFGAWKSVAGEVVFNTGMVGYPESLTDPSYRGQILVLTYPLIGNYGVPSKERDSNGLLKHFESETIQIAGLVVSDYSERYHHWSSATSLSNWLAEHHIPGIFGIDTRALTKKLREKGVMLGKIVCDTDIDLEDPNQRNLVAEVSIQKPILYSRGETRLVLVDCGVKNNIIRSLLNRNISVLRVPWYYDLFDPGLSPYQGVLVSNGPGDPKMCKETIEQIRKVMSFEIPLFGICLGNQILGLAAGGDTYKLKYGHRSQNQPCLEEGTSRCYITSQNHGYALSNDDLPEGWEPWFINANDGTNEGIRHKTKPFMSIQFHPEATPGPVDAGVLFDRFLNIRR
jgi:carbamoyl-phosphate synthase small subunit